MSDTEHLSGENCRNLKCFWLFCFPTEDQIPHGFPSIDMGPQLKVVERTRTATMLCAASGNPDPEIFWFKDFLPVDIGSSNGRIKQLRSGKSLHLLLCLLWCLQLLMLYNYNYNYNYFNYYYVCSGGRKCSEIYRKLRSRWWLCLESVIILLL